MKPILRVLQLNAASLFEPDWPARRIEIAAWLDHLDPDVVCLQEIWQDSSGVNSAEWLVDHQPNGRWFFCYDGILVQSPPALSPTVHLGSAILSRWPIESHQVHRLSVDQQHSATPTAENKLLEARTAGLDVFTTHLPPGYKEAKVRRIQVKLIDSIVRNSMVVPSIMPPILCGDFNAEPDSDEIRFLCGLTSIDGVDTSWHDAWRVIGDIDAGHTVKTSNPYFAPFRLPARRIDYIFIGETVRTRKQVVADEWQEPGLFPGKILSATVVCDKPLTGVYASDHCGLCVDIGWTS